MCSRVLLAQQKPGTQETGSFRMAPGRSPCSRVSCMIALLVFIKLQEINRDPSASKKFIIKCPGKWYYVYSLDMSVDLSICFLFKLCFYKLRQI